MAVVQKTYAELGDLWGVSKDAARKKVEGLHLPRRLGNDGKARVTIDLVEVTHSPMRKVETTPGDHREANIGDHREADPGDRQEVLALKGQISALEARAADLVAALDHERTERDRERQAMTISHDRERQERLAERDRADRITAELAELATRFTIATEDARSREGSLADRLAASMADAIALERTLQDRLDAARSEMAELRARPWWRRMAG